MSDLAALIARKLSSGTLTHPGDPANNVAPRVITLPFSMKAGQPKEMQDLMDATATMIGEAVVALIETEGDTELIPHDEADAMRVAGGDTPGEGSTVAVHCRCDPRGTPLLVFTMTHPDRAVVDGPSLLRALGKRTVHCPHDHD